MLRRPALACLAFAFAAPPAAQAAQREPVVVATAPDGARLTVSDARGAADAAAGPAVAVDRYGFTRLYALCLRALPPGRAPGRDCSELPAPSVDDPVELVETGSRSGRWFGGALPAAAAEAELVLAAERGRVSVRVPALDAPVYRGAFAGRVRFFLARVPDEARELLRVRVFTASGAPIGFEGFDDDIRIGRSASVGAGRLAHGGSWSVSASVLERTAPAAGAPERRERRACLTLRLTARDGAASTVNGCRDPRRHAAGMLVTLPDCDTRRTAVAALLPPRARRAALVLGDGRRLRLRVRQLPARFGAAERAAFRPVPAGQAVRAIRVGRRVRRLALAPAGLECGSSFEPPGRPLDRSGLPGPFEAKGLDLVTPPVAAVPGADVLARIDLAGRPVELLGTTMADDLCVGLAQPPLMPGGCAPPPLRGRQPRLAGFRPPGGGPAAIALVTAPTAASAGLLDLRFGEPRIVASAPTAPAGAGRVALLGLPAGRTAQAVRLLDTEGHVLADVALPAMATGATRTVARGKRWLATATPLRSAEAIPGGLIPVSRTCVEVGRRATADLAAACADQAPGQVDVVARCAPRLLHVYGALGRAVRRVTLVLAGGRRRSARIAHGAFHGLLRGREELRRVELRSAAGRVTESVRLRAPAPAAQCGYRAREVQAAGGLPGLDG